MMNAKMDKRLTSRLTRYLSFSKYVSFLKDGLFLANSQSFEDPWEGHIFHSITAKSENLEPLSHSVNDRKQYIYVSCWHASEHESYAMWRIYGKDEAVAIHTDGEKLRGIMQAVHKHHGSAPILLSPIDYVMPFEGRLSDLQTDKIYSVSFENKENPEHNLWRNDMQQLLCLKPKPYEYEKEVRLLALDADAPPFLELAEDYLPRRGIFVPVDLDSFITEVTVAPWATDDFFNSVIAVSEKFGIGREKIKKSKLFDGPDKQSLPV
jgi:hypothetical protein